GRRRRQPPPVAPRAGEALRDPAAGLLGRARRGDADAQAEAQGLLRPFRSGDRGALRDAAGADVGCRVPGVAEARDLDDVAGVRRVDELAAADVDPVVAE